ENWSVGWSMIREVKAVADVATEENVVVTSYRRQEGAKDDVGAPFGHPFTLAGTGTDRTLTFHTTKDALGVEIAFTKSEKDFFNQKFKVLDPRMFEMLECLLPDGPIAAD